MAEKFLGKLKRLGKNARTYRSVVPLLD